MALLYLGINSFRDAENWYNAIVPINEREHGTARDIRPVGDRGRKHERIVKVSRNCYAMYDGGRFDPLFRWNGLGAITEREAIMLAPIVWRRDSQGNEFLRIRNETGTSAHMSRYSFLDRAIPQRMRLAVRNGKQFIWDMSSGRNYYLPKCRTVTSAERKKALENAKTYGTKWTKRWADYTTSRDDKLYLEFKREGDSWVVVHAPEMETPPRVRVNKEAKAKIKPHANKFWEWWCAVAPLMSDVSWETRNNYYKILDEYRKEHNIRAHTVTKAMYVDILMNEHHPLRMYMAYEFVIYSDLYDRWNPCTDEKKLRAKFNRWVNKVCELTTTVKE